MNINEINRAIRFGQLTDSELTSIIESVKFARRTLQRLVKQSIAVGDNVEFTTNKTRRLVRGFVTKIAIKYVTVDTGMGLWKVPANMLIKLDKETA